MTFNTFATSPTNIDLGMDPSIFDSQQLRDFDSHIGFNYQCFDSQLWDGTFLDLSPCSQDLDPAGKLEVPQ
jgi:hypothetical protein